MGDKVEPRPIIGSSSPITIAALVGMGWGLAFGFVDSLPALLEGDVAASLGRRLLTVTYVAVFNALVFGMALTAVGILVWLGVRLTGRQPERASILGLLVGLCAGITFTLWALNGNWDAEPIMVALLALGVAIAAGWLVRAAAGSVLDGRDGEPGHPRVPRAGIAVLVILAAGIVVLLAATLYRLTVRDSALMNPRLTDAVASPERPNIVLISIDALRADRLGIYGNDPDVSPRIDALAEQGIVFQQAVSQGSSTVPSVSSFLTSLFPTELGIMTKQKWDLDETRVTLAEALQVAGYRTQGFVTNGHLTPSKGYAQGFDGFVAPEPGRPYGIDRLRRETVAAGSACRTGGLLCTLFDSGYQLLFDPLLVVENEGGRVNTLARRFVRLHGEERFFLWLHYMEPHSAYRPSDAFGPIPSTVSDVRQDWLRGWQPSNKTLPAALRPDDVQALLALYDGEILDVDRWVGGIWDEIEAQGIKDRTLLVITADHGDEFGEHGDYGHGHTVYQELNRVPLIVVGPQVMEPGRKIGEPVALLDLVPTLLDVAGAPLPDLVRGQSLRPVLEGSAPAQRAIISESPARRASYDDKAIRRGDYKLVYNVKLDKMELYNIAADPGEQHDLATAEPDRAQAMRDELRTWTAAAIETWASLPRAGSQAEELDEAMQEALRQIGY